MKKHNIEGLKDSNNIEIYVGDKISYISLYENHSDAMDYFDVEPQLNYSVDEVYLEKLEGVVEFKNGSFMVGKELLYNVINPETIYERIKYLDYIDELSVSLREFIKEEKFGFKVKNFRDIFKVEVLNE